MEAINTDLKMTVTKEVQMTLTNMKKNAMRVKKNWALKMVLSLFLSL